jgi:hypothetical protein
MSRSWGDDNIRKEFSLKSLGSIMPLWIKVIFIGQFAVYALIAYVLYHFISKVW